MYNFFLLENMLIGSSLARQLAHYIKGGQIFLKGNVCAGYIQECLLEVGFVERIIKISENDI